MTSNEETTAVVEEEADEMFVKVADLESFMQQISFTLMSVVNGINQTIEELKKESNSDDNKD
jgi:hypothetical protein|tara:strand:- start:235 stop:420 length:186 start_codon:yes stop_codon:yes gene_type:complete